MKEFKQKRDFNKKFFSPASFAVVSIIAIILIISTFKIYVKSRNAQLKNERATQELADVEKRRAELEAEMAKLGTDSGLEEEIRDKFNVKKPGEEILAIVDKSPENDKINSDEGRGFFSKIWEFVKSVF